MVQQVKARTQRGKSEVRFPFFSFLRFLSRLIPRDDILYYMATKEIF
jgi:hypothetical protein